MREPQFYASHYLATVLPLARWAAQPMIRGSCAAVEHLASGGLPDPGDAEAMAAARRRSLFDIASRWCHCDRDH